MSKREAAVTLLRPWTNRVRTVARFTTIKRAEAYIAKREKRDPDGVHRGDYGIDATPRAMAEYDRLRRRSA